MAKFLLQHRATLRIRYKPGVTALAILNIQRLNLFVHDSTQLGEDRRKPDHIV